MKRFLLNILMLIVIFGTIYTVVQQSQRSDANYPQIQVAEDAAAKLNNNKTPASLVGDMVDMKTSLSTFTIIYDKSGHVVSGSGYLENQVPSAPLGVLQAADGKDYSAVTWQPETGVRAAAVTVSANKYYVLSGRSLAEVEKNEDHTMQLSFIGGLVAVLVLCLYFISGRQWSSKTSPKKKA